MIPRPPVELDLECLPNYFLAKFYFLDGTFREFAMWPGQELDRQGIVDLLARVTIYTFNGNNYDMPVLTLALYGADLSALKVANDLIIMRGMKPWEFYQHYNIQMPDYIDHVDVMETAPGVRIGLKMYMCRMHAPLIQDLPFDPNAALDPIGRITTARYCGNDLVGTRMLREGIAERLKLRLAIGEKYKIDVRSKSDAQIAESVFKAKLDFRPEKRYIQHGYSFQYTPPSHVVYATPHMRELLDIVRNAQFTVTDKEEAYNLGIEEGVKTGVQIPPELKGRDIRHGQGVYRMGIGGLHSQESCVSYYARHGWQIIDIDVKSYYPSLILAMGMNPTQIGPAFSAIYRAIYDQRLAAKAEAGRLKKMLDYLDGDEKAHAKELYAKAKAEESGLKIVLNGTFGKLFSKYSIFYAPEFGIATTVSGQLNLLMLIEMMELCGIRVVSANTDGIVLFVPPGFVDIARSNIAWWESATGMEMEETHYRSIHFRDVNNYVAITTDGEAKRKGVFGESGLLAGPAGKHPDKDICGEAVVAFLKDGTPVHQTIQACTDIRKFLQVRAVKGGGVFVDPLKTERPYLGKAVRWYYGNRGDTYIAYSDSGNRVAGSAGCVPIMRLPESLPDDINYQLYIDVADEMLRDVGVDPPHRYWYHAESDCWFSTHDKDLRQYYESGCDEVTWQQYTKRKL